MQEILCAGCNDEFDDIFQLLSPMEINNIEFLLDDTPLKATDFLELESYVKLPRDNLEQEVTKVDLVVDRVSPSPKKKGRPKVVSIRRQRDAANARERNRMHQLARYRKK